LICKTGQLTRVTHKKIVLGANAKSNLQLYFTALGGE
jgi:hypothetical protein